MEAKTPKLRVQNNYIDSDAKIEGFTVLTGSWLLIYRPRRDGRLSWPCAAGWLHTEISFRHRELNPDTIAHLITNRARRTCIR